MGSWTFFVQPAFKSDISIFTIIIAKISVGARNHNFEDHGCAEAPTAPILTEILLYLQTTFYHVK